MRAGAPAAILDHEMKPHTEDGGKEGSISGSLTWPCCSHISLKMSLFEFVYMTNNYPIKTILYRVFLMCIRILSNIPSNICWKSISESWSAFLLIALDYDDMGYGLAMCWWGAGRKNVSGSILGKITKSKTVTFSCLLSELPLSRNVLSRLLL